MNLYANECMYIHVTDLDQQDPKIKHSKTFCVCLLIHLFFLNYACHLCCIIVDKPIHDAFLKDENHLIELYFNIIKGRKNYILCQISSMA